MKNKKKIKEAIIEVAENKFMKKNLEDYKFLKKLKENAHLSPEEKLKLFFEQCIITIME